MALHDATRTAIVKRADGIMERGIHDLDELGPPPTPPLSPHILLSDPTIEGVLRHFEEGQPSIGIFSDEGGQLFGGHAMNVDNRLKTSAALSKLWDGAPVNRARASAPVATYYGRRASFYLMMQPRIAEVVLADPVLRDQGLLSRTLIAWPDSRIGFRMIPEDADAPQQSQALRQADTDVAGYERRLLDLLEKPRPSRNGDPRELVPRLLAMEADAREVLIAFANAVERAQRPGDRLETIRGFASKAAEQAARIATVLTVYADPDAEAVGLSAMRNAIELTTWHLREAQRLLDCGKVPEDLLDADALRTWLADHWTDDQINVRSVVRCGPKRVRTTERVRQLFKILEEHGWLIPVETGRRVVGRPVRMAWRIVRG